METSVEIKMGKMPASWGREDTKSITFCVTEDCNLACRYCYMTGKNNKRKMNFETAKRAIDYFLSDRENFSEGSVIWEFIGGEPLLEIDLVDQICDYIKLQMFTLEHPWFNSYRFSFSTNGLLYSTPKVQAYILKNIGHLSIGMSIDGNKIKHDMQRIKPDGSGSYDDVVKNAGLWLDQFPGSATKATFAHNDLPFLKDSIISLWNIGIKSVAANVVFEDVWSEGDDEIMEQQLKRLADYVLENGLWRDYSVRFFDPDTGHALTEEEQLRNYCGAGKMVAIDCEGSLFPCVRFYDFSLNNRKGLRIGDIYNGIDQNKIRPFLGLNFIVQSNKECIECDVSSGCAWCQGNNYDMADTDTIYQRATYNCKIHKAAVRANKYFWDKFERVTGLISERRKVELERNTNHSTTQKYLQFITSDNITPHCSYHNTIGTDNVMSRGVFERGLEFCNEKGFIPVMLGHPEYLDPEEIGNCLLIDSASMTINNKYFENTIYVYNNSVNFQVDSENSILLINKENIVYLYDFAVKLFHSTSRINLKFEDIEVWGKNELESYKDQLDLLVAFLAEEYKNENELEINILTDIWDLEAMRSCDAGINTFSLAPNGKFYICPAFYFDNPDNYIGSIDSAISIKNNHLFKLENAPICSACDVYSCSRCKFLNKKLTNEFNTPSKNQCVISHIERNKSLELQRLIMEQEHQEFNNILKNIDYLDPLDKVLRSLSTSPVL